MYIIHLMTTFYTLEYKNKMMGIYNKIHFILDFMLELLEIPDYDFNINETKISLFETNISYPQSIIKFVRKNDKLFMEENNGKRINMMQDTFNRFKRIQKIIEIKDKKNIPKISLKKPRSSLEQTSPTINGQICTLTNIESEQHKEDIYKLNRLKINTKMLENWINQYKSDIKLFNVFKEKLEEDVEFVIPPLFTIKYTFFTNLNDINDIDNNFNDYFTEFNKNSKLDINEITELLSITLANNNSDNDSDSDSDNDGDDDDNDDKLSTEDINNKINNLLNKKSSIDKNNDEIEIDSDIEEVLN